MDGNAIADVVTQYMAAWNEPDATTRDALLEQCWSDGGAYVDPKVSLAGREALARHIATVQAARPGARLEFMSGIDVHHNLVRFLWRLVRGRELRRNLDRFWRGRPRRPTGQDRWLFRCSAIAPLNRPEFARNLSAATPSQLPPAAPHVMTPGSNRGVEMTVLIAGSGIGGVGSSEGLAESKLKFRRDSTSTRAATDKVAVFAFWQSEERI